MQDDPQFDEEFRRQFQNLLKWRRDVRRFRPDPLPEQTLQKILSLTRFAPSVGLSEPWRYVRIIRREIRDQIKADFEKANAKALSGYSGEQAVLYARLKLAGLDSAPVQLAVFSDRTTIQGSGLGCHTMPEMIEYSTVASIMTLWLAARAFGVGMGWVSVLNPENISAILCVPAQWRLVAYLCLGYPASESSMPELEEAGWESRRDCISLLER